MEIGKLGYGWVVGDSNGDLIDGRQLAMGDLSMSKARMPRFITIHTFNNPVMVFIRQQHVPHVILCVDQRIGNSGLHMYILSKIYQRAQGRKTHRCRPICQGPRTKERRAQERAKYEHAQQRKSLGRQVHTAWHYINSNAVSRLTLPKATGQTAM